MKNVDIDLETIRLKPSRKRGVLWEIGLIDDRGAEYLWQIRPDLEIADPTSLRIGRYHQRIHPYLRLMEPGVALRMVHPDQPSVADDDGDATYAVTSARHVADELAGLIDGTLLWGSNVGAFDVPHLDPWMRLHGSCGSPHYHSRDIVSWVGGWCAAKGIAPAPADTKSDDWSRAAGVDPDQFERHTALGDCRWTRAMRLATSAPGDAR